MPVYHATVVENSKKQDKWFTSYEEAETFMRRKRMMEFQRKVPAKGISEEAKADIALSHLDALNSELAEVSSLIQEYIRPKD